MKISLIIDNVLVFLLYGTTLFTFVFAFLKWDSIPRVEIGLIMIMGLVLGLTGHSIDHGIKLDKIIEKLDKLEGAKDE